MTDDINLALTSADMAEALLAHIVSASEIGYGE